MNRGKPFFSGERQYKSCECTGPDKCGDLSCMLVRDYQQAKNKKSFTPIPTENEVKCETCGVVRNKHLLLCPECG